LSQINNTPQIHFKQNVQQDKYKYVPKDYMRVAEGMEAQFTNHLLAQMRKTVDSANPVGNAEKIYRSMLDDERSKLMANSTSGLGVKDMVLDQIYPQYKQLNQRQAVQMYNKNLDTNSHKGENNE
jgi:Rod binding domain-containing protein